MIFRIRARLAARIRRAKLRMLDGMHTRSVNHSQQILRSALVRILDGLFVAVTPLSVSDIVSSWRHVVTLHDNNSQVICTGRLCDEGWEVTMSRTGYPAVQRVVLPEAPSIQDALLEGYKQTQIALSMLDGQDDSTQ